MTFNPRRKLALLFGALLLSTSPAFGELAAISFTAQDIGASPEQHLVEWIRR
jgi:hypothetical protein